MKCPTCDLDLFQLTDEEKSAIRRASNFMKASGSNVQRKIGEALERAAEKIEACAELRPN